LDAIGTKRFDSDKSGDREVQRTMLELLNQLDGFSSDDKIKVRTPCVHALSEELLLIFARLADLHSHHLSFMIYADPSLS
jgi:hypothetical protein